MQWLLLPHQDLPRFSNGGIFVAREEWTHPVRVIDSYELIICLKGQIHLAEEEKSFTLQPGQTLFFLPGRLHRGVRSSPAGISFAWLHFTTAGATVHLREGESWEEAVAGLALPDYFLLPRTQKLPQPERVLELCYRLLHYQETGFYTPKALDFTLALLFFELTAAAVANSRPGKQSPSGDASVWAGRAIREMEMHYSEPLSPQSLARTLGLNPDYLGRLFRRATGQTLLAYLTAYRLRQAKTLLRTTNLLVNEIAAAVGFSDPHYFTRVFKASEGLTPSQFRRLFSRAHINIK